MKPAINMKALKADLRDALLGYRRERPHLSLRAIAKNSGCNRYFLTKLVDETDTSSSIDLNQVLIFSQFITGRASVKEAIEVSGSSVKESLSAIINLDAWNERKISLRMSEVDLFNSDNYFVLVLASYGRGTKREYVNKILGYKGEQALRKLLSDEIVVEVNGRIRLKEGNEFTLSMEVMKQRIPDYLKYYSFERSYQQKNYIHVYSEGLTEEAIRKVYEQHLKLNAEIEAIISDKSNHGDIPFFSFGCMDRLYEEESEENALH